MKNSINFSIKQILFKHSQKKPTVGFSDFAPYGDPNTSNRSQVASPLRCPGPFWRFIRPSGRRSWRRTMGRFATGEWIGNATGISWDITDTVSQDGNAWENGSYPTIIMKLIWKLVIRLLLVSLRLTGYSLWLMMVGWEMMNIRQFSASFADEALLLINTTKVI